MQPDCCTASFAAALTAPAPFSPVQPVPVVVAQILPAAELQVQLYGALQSRGPLGELFVDPHILLAYALVR